MAATANSPIGRLLQRHAESAIREALQDTRVVLVNGARQSGKSTLLRQIARADAVEWRDLDSPVIRQAALADPSGFVDYQNMMVIDEIQRVPELLLPIKVQVDNDARPGRYLLSGSARVLGLRGLPDTLPGRMETIELWPFSQGEIDEAPDGLIDAIFAHGADLRHASQVSRAEYADRIVRGGFPEAIARSSPRRRERFHDSYVADLVARDVMQLSDIERTAQMRALIRLLAARSGQLLVASSVGNQAGVSQATALRYIGLLEKVFLIKRVPPGQGGRHRGQGRFYCRPGGLPRAASPGTASGRRFRRRTCAVYRAGHPLLRATPARDASQRALGSAAACIGQAPSSTRLCGRMAVHANDDMRSYSLHEGSP
jgi:predicted AAA+ superfamily ATPase